MTKQEFLSMSYTSDLIIHFTRSIKLFLLIMWINMLLCSILVVSIKIIPEKQSVKTEKQFVPLTDFELIELAIIWQESKANPNPKYSDGNSEGILQITPIYVKEANRILGKSEYTLHDRRNPLKSHEMFLVVQSYHNPEKDVKKAIKLHNKAGWYFEEVMDRYNCLKLYQEVLMLKNR